ncbi:cobyric acid synthase [Kallotenue papyrolyticum]|uniref:cobyric acid synthase n=1 Tax=Kallotenue papyrolyticum TaxID=1325125 RepID=UPI0004786022|nr:cobyric acid synthase [Kallotenue papyrolyticum]
MPAPVVMVLGTASSVGKSTLVTGLCRLAARRGLRVAPFKAQNMSNNAAVTADGGEIARSTAVQAEAAGIQPTVQMNPILIKPEGGTRSQIVVEGRVWRALEALEYWQRKQELWSIVQRNLDVLRAEYDLVIAEGAGSPVELNLKAADIVNLRVASYAGARTLLVGDINTGGIFAQLLGTLLLMEPAERALIQGLVVNRFRGDPRLFADGITILEQRSGLPVLGVLPWVDDLGLAEEDGVALDRPPPPLHSGVPIAVVRLPHIANFDDLDPLRREAGVAVHFIDRPAQLAGMAAVILPGTKHTLAAWRWLVERGFDTALRRFSGSIVGICGGYQLLGLTISDPQGIEGQGGEVQGLGLLPIETVFQAHKRTAQVAGRARLPWAHDLPVAGYEIHMGVSRRRAGRPAMLLGAPDAAEPIEDGCVSADGRVWGCYLHGLFANHELRRAWLRTLGWHEPDFAPAAPDPYERLADLLEQHLDHARLTELLTP